MNGAESLVATLLASGVEVCFANPGTSEIHMVKALDGAPRLRSVLGLFEGVVTGAADGYYRIARKPAATLLHLGPGLANGLANLHNARKAGSAIVNIVGDHSTGHVAFESPLRSDVAAIAESVSHWVRSARSSLQVATDAADAISATRDGALGQIATLIVPADAAWGPGGDAVIARGSAALVRPRPDAVLAAARALGQLGSRALLLLGAGGVDENSLAAAVAIARTTGCRVLTEFYNARIPGGRGRAYVERLPFAVEHAVAKLGGIEVLVLAGAAEPIAFFAYPAMPSALKPAACQVLTLADARENVPAALEALRSELSAKPGHAATREPTRDIEALRNAPALNAEVIADVLARLLPPDAIVVDEAVTTGRGFGGRFVDAEPHDWLAVMGGAIGFGLPAALGAAIGAPGRPVIALEGDGAAMYTVQALWSIARESLPVVAVIFANRSYRILQAELKALAPPAASGAGSALLRLDQPPLDWVALARGHGVPAARASSADAFVREMQRALASGGPYLVEVVL